MKASNGFGVIFFTLLFLESLYGCDARDTITLDSPFSANGETLVSAGRKFELGFFTPEGKTDRGKYVGIWYCCNSSLPRTVVWVANRKDPIPEIAFPGVRAILEDGNLKVLNRQLRTSYFSTDLRSSPDANPIAKLLDSGNLALIDSQSGAYLWQSFAQPTDTFLPGMSMVDNLKLISWASHSDPKAGNYTFQIDQDDNKQFSIMERTVLHWKSDQSGGLIRTLDMPIFVVAFLFNCNKSMFDQYKSSSANGNFTYYGKHPKTPAYNYSAPLANARLLMNSFGEVQFYMLDYQDNWSLLWSEPHDSCSVYNPCGNFGICSNRNGSFTCECLPGFEPNSPDNWNSREYSSGCTRKSPICKKNTRPDAFLNLKLMKVGSKYSTFDGAENETKCREECLSNCQCQAYFYVGLNGRSGTNNAGASCLIWTTELVNLQSNYSYTDGIQNFAISIRVAASDIQSTTRDCESCGQNILPYPLSRGSNCGDPSYQSFKCDNSTGRLQFLTLNGIYEVASLNMTENTLVILVNEAANATNCNAEDPATRVVMLNRSLPFDVTNWCYNDETKGRRKIQLRWRPPLEPLCNISDNCTQDWPDSVCNVTADRMRRCLCRPNYRWDSGALNCTLEVGAPLTQQSERSKRKDLIISITVVSVVLLAGSIFCFIFRRRFLFKRKETKEIFLGNPVQYLDDRERGVQDYVAEDNKAIDVPFFSMESILVATDNFSDSNKLGQGGFGPVYKGLFAGGNEIAVKRLSSHSLQGTGEFQNEVILIAKLQHRNLVRLLGYCIKGSEKLLLYEYMPNKSLDTFIFDHGRCMLLDWKKRFDIIVGITRGLLYLHQDSRLRVIHRDLKTSNILLDEELNPKISDFGLARIVGGKETGANTEKVVGTYGYLSPEYALEGLFSIKSDVFSFGVILLEIISGNRNIGFHEEALSLLGYAWKLWQERKPLEFIDKNLLESCEDRTSEVLKCINIGLLCVQEDPADRPTMANVLIMLGSETATLPNPNQPAFVSRKRPESSISGSSSSKPHSNSINRLTASVVEGR